MVRDLHCQLYIPMLTLRPDVLTLSKINSDLLTISTSPVEVIVMVKEALKMFDGELRKADIDLSILEDASLDQLEVSWVLLDPGRVLQVLINLMTNAIKFTRTEPTRSIEVKIAASFTKPSRTDSDIEYFPQRDRRQLGRHPECVDGNSIYLSFSVRDTGIGLSSEEQKSLFNRFSQGSPKTQIKYGGSGLGLFISRQLSEMQGGEIGLASKSGKGSTFVFFVKSLRTLSPHLSVAPEEKTDILHSRSSAASYVDQFNAADETMERKSTLKTCHKRPCSPLKILVVEDNLVNQRVLMKQLRRNGMIVEAANHGGEALEALQKTTAWQRTTEGRRFDVVLMDLEMPVMDGLTCVRRIRELEAAGLLHGHTQVIAVTANVRSEYVQLAMQSGVDDFTTKPYKLDDILSQIDRLSSKCY
jgi:CheY-like chemotaxis protein